MNKTINLSEDSVSSVIELEAPRKEPPPVIDIEVEEIEENEVVVVSDDEEQERLVLNIKRARREKTST